MYISSETNFENLVDEPLDLKKITWYTIKANLAETKREVAEKQEAIKKQIAMGILQPNGLPVGLDPSLVGAPTTFTTQKPPPMIKFNNMRPQEKIQFLKQQSAKKLTEEQKLYSKFGIRK